MKRIIYKTNKLIINNKIKYGEYKITIQVEKYFTNEMKKMIQLVNNDIEMDFSSIYFQDIYNKKLHIVTRVNNEIVAYHQLIDAKFCILNEILNQIKISNDEEENHNVLLFNFSCVNPKYRMNLFNCLNYLIAYKYAIENNYSYISEFIRRDSIIQHNAEQHGLKKIVPNVFRIRDCWNSYHSNIDTHFYISDNLKINSTLYQYHINNLLDLNLSNDRSNYLNILKNNLIFKNNKSKL